MKRNLIFTIICYVAFVDNFVPAASQSLQCYQCEIVTQECEENKASIIQCGNPSMSRCSRQVKKDGPNKSVAVRKCVVADQAGNVNCPVGWECFNCDTNLCNANPITTTASTTASTTSTKKNSASVVKCAWTVLCAIIFIVISL